MRVVITAAISVLSGVFGGLATNDFNVACAIGIGLIAICMTLDTVGDRIVEKRKDGVMGAIVVFHCVNSSTGEIYQSEQRLLYGRGADGLNRHIEDQKCEFAEQYQRPIIVHQIVML